MTALSSDDAVKQSRYYSGALLIFLGISNAYHHAGHQHSAMTPFIVQGAVIAHELV